MTSVEIGAAAVMRQPVWSSPVLRAHCSLGLLGQLRRVGDAGRFEAGLELFPDSRDATEHAVGRTSTRARPTWRWSAIDVTLSPKQSDAP